MAQWTGGLLRSNTETWTGWSCTSSGDAPCPAGSCVERWQPGTQESTAHSPATLSLLPGQSPVDGDWELGEPCWATGKVHSYYTCCLVLQRSSSWMYRAQDTATPLPDSQLCYLLTPQHLAADPCVILQYETYTFMYKSHSTLTVLLTVHGLEYSPYLSINQSIYLLIYYLSAV